MSKAKRKAHGFIELAAGQDPIVDIVAIHGLDGHREQSWTAEDGTIWLKDLLPNEIPNARIISYGYDADTHSFSRTSTQTIFRHAEAFAEDLSRLRRKGDPKVSTRTTRRSVAWYGRISKLTNGTETDYILSA
ncbi:hypothetical protein FRB91_005902 [Serendipita sp. 411]|nr:hypothetical protein FRB91_005902 [Serendipita sp. 411]